MNSLGFPIEKPSSNKIPNKILCPQILKTPI